MQECAGVQECTRIRWHLKNSWLRRDDGEGLRGQLGHGADLIPSHCTTRSIAHTVYSDTRVQVYVDTQDDHCTEI